VGHRKENFKMERDSWYFDKGSAGKKDGGYRLDIDREGCR
jgi:hypothetical protein